MAVRETFTQNLLRRKYFVGLLFVVMFIGLVGLIKPRHHVEASNYTYVTVHYDGTTQTVATHAKTVGQVLERAHIPVGSNDDVEPNKNTALLSNDYNVNIYRARPVTVVDGAHSYHVFTAAQSPTEMAKAAGLKVHAEDKMVVSRIDDFVDEGGIGLKVNVTRSVPVTLNMYGTSTQIRTQAKTVGELLAEKDITMQRGDEVHPKATTPIKAGMTVSLLRNGTQLTTVQEEVPFTTKTIQDADQPVGYHKVQTEGKKGKKLVTYQVELKNGKEVGRKEINSITQSQPVQQVEIVGSKQDNTGTADGDFAKLRQCESGGNYSENTGNGFYGAYQYDIGTWGNYGGYSRPDQAPPAVQDQKAKETQAARGWSPWPSCSAQLGLN